MSRFSQAISEGDGISVIPLLGGDVAGQAELAQAAGAEAVAVGDAADAERARARTSLAIVILTGQPDAVSAAGADACVLRFDELDGDDRLERLHARAGELGLACAVEVRDEEELEEALARVDPEIIVISERDPRPDEEELERTLDLLADVPAGKLVISESRPAAREQVVALERAGVDAVLVSGLAGESDFAAALEELVRGPTPRR